MVVFNAKEHIKLGLAFALPFYLPRVDNHAEFILGVVIGSLLPDVDHENSIAGSIIPLWKFVRHGRQTHTVLVIILLIALYITFDKTWIYGVTVGYFSHLLGDELQGNNLKYLFYPFKRGWKARK